MESLQKMWMVSSFVVGEFLLFTYWSLSTWVKQESYNNHGYSKEVTTSYIL